MSDTNMVTLIGDLNKTSELKEFDSGTSVLNMTLRVVTPFVKADGEESQRTDYFKVDLWNPEDKELAGLPKGTRVLVNGSLRNRTWTGSGGSRGITTLITADEVEVIDHEEAEVAANTAAVPSTT